MDFWKLFSHRWEKEELKKWSSLKKTAYLLLPLLIYFLVHDIVEFILWILAAAGGSGRILTFFQNNGYTLQGIIYGISILAGVAAVYPAVRGELRKPEKSSGKKGIDADRLTAYFFLAAFAFCTAVSLNIIFTQTGFTGSSQNYDSVYKMQYGVQFAVGIILYGIISPFAEEAVFRGLLYNRMKRCFGYEIALIVSSLLFGLYHGNLVQAVYGSLLGILIAYTYEKYENFAAPVVFHGVANVSVYIMTYGNRFAKMDGKAAFATAAVMSVGAVSIFFYIKKKFFPNKNG